MPINVSVIQYIDDMKDLMKNPPKDPKEYAKRFASDFNKYAAQVVPPSLTFEAAHQAMLASLQDKPGPWSKVSKIEIAFENYVDILYQGMTPLFTGIKPVSKLSFDVLIPLSLSGAKPETIAELMVTTIHLWMITGQAVNNASGATINWT